MKKKILYIAALLCIITDLSSCKKYLTEAPLDSPTTGNYFNNQGEMNVALTGVYNSINWDTGALIPWQILFDQWTDIGVERTAGLAEGTYDVNNSNVATSWTFAYTTIQRANTLIQGMETGKANVPAAAYNTMQAEARVLRAFAYYHLVFMFGDVPLITAPLSTTDYYTQVRTPKADIIKFLYNELDAAAVNLNWVSSDRGRIGRAVALGLKARVALTNGDYDLAATTAKQVMDNAGLGLNPNYQDLFTRAGQNANSGKEIMFELMYSDAVVNSRNYIPLGQGSRNLGGQSGRFPTQRLVDLFEAKDGKRIDESVVYDPARPSKNRDKRLKYTVIMQGDTITQNRATAVYEIYNANTYFLDAASNKYTLKTNNDFSNAYGPVKNGVGYLWAKYTFTYEDINTPRVSWLFMRYAEILLTYAEAKIESGPIDATVVNSINLLRKRAGLPNVDPLIAADQNKMRQLIRRERTVELAGEGFRWFDIRRWKIAELVMPGKVYGASLSATVTAPTPNFKTSAVTDLNSIPDYTTSATLRFSRDIRYFQTKHYLFPVPQRERDLDKSLTQNTGW